MGHRATASFSCKSKGGFNMNIKDKNFFEANTSFLVHFEGMENMDEKVILLKIIDLIHDGAEINGIDARRIVVEKVDD